MRVKRFMSRYYDRNERLPIFLKRGQTADKFHRFRKYFSFIQRLNIFGTKDLKRYNRDLSGSLFFLIPANVFIFGFPCSVIFVQRFFAISFLVTLFLWPAGIFYMRKNEYQ